MAEQKQLQISKLDPKTSAIMIFEHWFRIIMNDNSISIKDITNIIIKYYNIGRILKWSKTLKSKTGGFEYSDDNKCVKRIDANRCCYKWIAADIKPVNEGIHCWRVNANHTKNESGWIVYGVSPPNPDLKDNYGQKDAWGVTYNDCCYPSEQNRVNTGGICKHLYQKNLDVDILLNLEEQILTIGIVGEIDAEHEYKLKGIKRTNEFGGWVPQFNLFQNSYKCDTVGCELRIAEISPELYGQKLEYNIFAASAMLK